MKAFIVLALVAAVARAGVVHSPVGVYGVAETGASQVSRTENGLGSYAFGYDEAHTSGGSFHKESGSPGVKVGSYGLTGADGRVRVVNYVADALGFRADVKTNEPGVGAQDPAATLINKAGVVGAYAAAPVAAYAAAPVVGAYAAPIATAVAAPVLGASYSTHVAHGGIAPVVGAAYTAGIGHGIGGLGYAGAIHHGLGYAGGIHSGLGYTGAINHGLGYTGAIHHGLGYTGAIHHGLGYSGAIHNGLGLGYASAIHGGLGYAGLGHVTKIGHGAALLGGHVKVL